jgi:hypothetical protein
MAIFDVVNTGTLIALAWRLAWALWRDERASRGALVLFTLGTPFGHACALLLVYFWALARWLAGGGPRWLATGALAAAGIMLFHGAAGRSAVTIALVATALAALLRPRAPWLPPVRALAASAGATLLGAAACLPYTLAISAGWDGHQPGTAHSYFQPGLGMPWTILAAGGIALLLAFAGVRRAVAERRAAAAWLALWALGMLAFACVVRPPEGGGHELVVSLLAAIAMLGGVALLPAIESTRRRHSSRCCSWCRRRCSCTAVSRIAPAGPPRR